jgi:hypothetical protein
MIGFSPKDDKWRTLTNGKLFIYTKDVDDLMHPESVLAETAEEAAELLRQSYPDIEEGYGQVRIHDYHSVAVYDSPGLLSEDPAIAERVCRKYGAIPNHARFNPYGNGPTGFILSGNGIRYDEKKKKKQTAKAEKTIAAKRSNKFIHQMIYELAYCDYKPLFPTMTERLKSHINLGQYVTVHYRTLFYAELLMATTCDGQALHCERYKALAKEWANSVTDNKQLDESYVKTVTLLDKIFSRKETPAALAG